MDSKQIKIIIISCLFCLCLLYPFEFPIIRKNFSDSIINKCKNQENQKDVIYCSFKSAIEYTFKQIQTNKYNFPSDNEDCKHLNLCLHYNEVQFKNIKCENMFFMELNNIKELVFEDCTILIDGKIKISNQYDNVIEFGSLFSEFYYKEINFKYYESKVQLSNVENFEVNINDTIPSGGKAYMYNEEESFFTIDYHNLTSQMEENMIEIRQIFIDDYKELINSTNKENDKLKSDNLLTKVIVKSQDSFYYSNCNKKSDFEQLFFSYISFIKYRDYQDSGILHTKDAIFIPQLEIIFEYSFNCGFFYNDDYLIIRDFIFSKNENNKDDKAILADSDKNSITIGKEEEYKKILGEEKYGEFKENLYKIFITQIKEYRNNILSNSENNNNDKK